MEQLSGRMDEWMRLDGMGGMMGQGKWMDVNDMRGMSGYSEMDETDWMGWVEQRVRSRWIRMDG